MADPRSIGGVGGNSSHGRLLFLIGPNSSRRTATTRLRQVDIKQVEVSVRKDCFCVYVCEGEGVVSVCVYVCVVVCEFEGRVGVFGKEDE